MRKISNSNSYYNKLLLEVGRKKKIIDQFWFIIYIILPEEIVIQVTGI